jgi:hypothetical protein
MSFRTGIFLQVFCWILYSTKTQKAKWFYQNQIAFCFMLCRLPIAGMDETPISGLVVPHLGQSGTLPKMGSFVKLFQIGEGRWGMIET